MKQKITFVNKPTYNEQKKMLVSDNQKSPTLVNFNKPTNTTFIDIRNNQDQSYNKVQSSLNLNQTISFANDLSSVNKHLPNSKVNFNVGNINKSIIRIQQQLYKKQSIDEPTLPYEAFPKALKQTKTFKENKIEVTQFKIDTNQIQTVKQNQFIGCFHCFSQVKYQALKKN